MRHILTVLLVCLLLFNCFLAASSESNREVTGAKLDLPTKDIAPGELLIVVDMLEQVGGLVRYQVFVTTSCGKDCSTDVHRDILYDIRITSEIKDDETPQFLVDIRKTSEPVGMAVIPDLALLINEEERMYQFQVHTLDCSSEVTYAVALFDNKLNGFLRSEMITFQGMEEPKLKLEPQTKPTTDVEISDHGLRWTSSSSNYARYSWRIELKNNTSRKMWVNLHFQILDGESFELDKSLMYRKLLPPGTKSFTDNGMLEEYLADQVESYNVSFEEALY